MTVIYQPSGRAREYAEWACNLFRGCPHGCAYCFAPDVLRRTGITRYEFHKGAVPRKDILKKLRRSAEQQPEPRQVHLCFTCDPLPHPSAVTIRRSDPWLITQGAIDILKKAGHSVQLLSKGGASSLSGLDLLDERDEYATTLTLDNAQESRLWEPHAALPQDRLDALYYASNCGLVTWASLEPVIYPEQSLRMLEQALEAGISKVKIGPLNYKSRLPKWLSSTVPDIVDWPAFVYQAQEMCGSTVECILKEDMKALIGEGG